MAARTQPRAVESHPQARPLRPPLWYLVPRAAHGRDLPGTRSFALDDRRRGVALFVSRSQASALSRADRVRARAARQGARAHRDAHVLGPPGAIDLASTG